MPYIVCFLLIILGYISALPIVHESIEFRLVDCVTDETTSLHILEITDFNQSCIKINKLTSNNQSEISYYILPETTNGTQIKIKTENCSTTIPDLYLTPCDGENFDTNSTLIDHNDNSTMEAFIYTGPTVYETMHRFAEDDDDDTGGNHITTPGYAIPIVDDSSEE